MPLLKKISFDSQGRMIGFPEKGEAILLGVPTTHLTLFYSDAVKTNEMIENRDKDVRNARKNLISLVRQNQKLYFQIPKKPTKTDMYHIYFAYNSFQERK